MENEYVEKSNDILNRAWEFLETVNYPAEKQKIIQDARGQNINPDVIDLLEEIPDQEYLDANQVTEVLGNQDEQEFKGGS